MGGKSSPIDTQLKNMTPKRKNKRQVQTNVELLEHVAIHKEACRLKITVSDLVYRWICKDLTKLMKKR
jgi:ABC-type transport system involved in Fe-S cluster assembly fused permease/ATPase subunit